MDTTSSNAGKPQDGITWAILEKARSEAALPSSGIALRDYPPGAEVADVERDAGRTPLNRIASADGGGGGANSEEDNTG